MPRSTGPADLGAIERLAGASELENVTPAEQAQPVLVLSRQPAQAGAGALTAHATWQGPEMPELSVSPQDAQAWNLKNLSTTQVRTHAGCIRARVRVIPQAAPGTIVLPEGAVDARSLIPCRVDEQRGVIVCEPAGAEVSP